MKTDDNHIQLTQLTYSTELRNLRLYIYGSDGYHRGGLWIRVGRPVRDQREEVSLGDAKLEVDIAVAQKNEIRITNSGDMLVFHAKDGQVLYPEETTLEKFWGKVEAAAI